MHLYVCTKYKQNSTRKYACNKHRYVWITSKIKIKILFILDLYSRGGGDEPQTLKFEIHIIWRPKIFFLSFVLCFEIVKRISLCCAARVNTDKRFTRSLKCSTLQEYRVMQTNRNSFCGDVVLDSVNMTFRDE